MPDLIAVFHDERGPFSIHCKRQQRGSRAVCQGLRKGHEGDCNFVLPEGASPPKPKPVNRQSNQFRLAVLLSAILEEPQDDVENPHEVRMEQARKLLIAWNDAQGSMIGAAREILAIKQGYCVRCEERPCPVCGAA